MTVCPTEVTRRAIQKRQESLKALSERYGINHKTVATWRKRDVVHDAPMGPKQPHSTVLSPEEEAMCVGLSQIYPLAFGAHIPPSIWSTHPKRCRSTIS